jgi:hypothetical protein
MYLIHRTCIQWSLRSSIEILTWFLRLLWVSVTSLSPKPQRVLFSGAYFEFRWSFPQCYFLSPPLALRIPVQDPSVAQVAEHLPSQNKALSSNPSTPVPVQSSTQLFYLLYSQAEVKRKDILKLCVFVKWKPNSIQKGYEEKKRLCIHTCEYGFPILYLGTCCLS